jgi:hypothetical protein
MGIVGDDVMAMCMSDDMMVLVMMVLLLMYWV